jgi:leucyl aminopeptidase (aminopeptidase T)
MDTSHHTLAGARTVLEKCLELRPHESFLLIYDETTRDFVAPFQRAAGSCKIKFRRAFVSKRLQSQGHLAFKPRLSQALARVQGVLMATTDDERCTAFRLVLTGDKRNAHSAVATMPGARLSIISTAIDIDYNQIVSSCRNLTLPLIKGSDCTLHTYDSHGTEYTLTFKLPGVDRPPMQSVGIIPRQAWGNIPAGETFVAPLESSADGEYLVSGAVGTEKIRNGQEALLRFDKGRLVGHQYSGSSDPVAYLVRLEEFAKSQGHSDCWSVIAEFGIGVNRQLRKITGVQLIDEKQYGTVHVAIGHNVGYGGKNQCGSVHCDMTTLNPTVLIDGVTIIERGEHVHDFTRYEDDYRTFVPQKAYTWRPEYESVRLNENSFQIDGGKLSVKRTTASGRQTIYALGDSETAILGCDLVAIFRNQSVVQTTRAKLALKLKDSEFERFLSLLYQNGIVSP